MTVVNVYLPNGVVRTFENCTFDSYAKTYVVEDSRGDTIAQFSDNVTIEQINVEEKEI